MPKEYIDVLITGDMPDKLEERIIKDSFDELYSLQQKCGVKISRSPLSNVVYIFEDQYKMGDFVL